MTLLQIENALLKFRRDRAPTRWY